VKDALVHPRKTCEAMGVLLHSFLITALDGGEWIASRPVRFIPNGVMSRAL